MPSAIAWDSPVQFLKGVGPVRAQALSRLGIVTVAFDRNGYRFHGRLKALADAAREAGLKF